MLNYVTFGIALVFAKFSQAGGQLLGFSELNCSAPLASSILNAADPTCGEGKFIDPYFYCSPRCKPGYRPDVKVLNCFPNFEKLPPVAALYPPVFYCDADPCEQPEGIAYASDEPCGRRANTTIPHGSSCNSQCENGYTPTVRNLTCDAGKFVPSGFTCVPNNCRLSKYNGTIMCQEPGDLFFHGNRCAPRCPDGFATNEPYLRCHLGNMTPSSYQCRGLPCVLNDTFVANSHPDGPCDRGRLVPHGENCTARCANGFEPWCDGELEPRAGCELHCSASQLNRSFFCHNKPCQAPLTAGIANSNRSTEHGCLEGPLIQDGETCTPLCALGYTSDSESLTCGREELTPPIFNCLGMPCKAPTGIASTPEFTCAQGNTIEHGEACDAQCQFGYIPSKTTLECVAAELAPPTFECLGLDCNVPSDVEFAADPPCENAIAGKLSHGSACTARCLFGYEPSVDILPCDGSMLRPSTFRCIPLAVVNAQEPLPSGIVSFGTARNHVLSPLSAGSVALCFKDAAVRDATKQWQCKVIGGTVRGLATGTGMEVMLPGVVGSLVMAAIAPGTIVTCYKSAALSEGIVCRILGSTGGYQLTLGSEAIIFEGRATSLTLTAIDVPVGGEGVLLCYQRATIVENDLNFSSVTSACACRVLRATGGHSIKDGKEHVFASSVGGSAALKIAATGLKDGKAVVCLIDALRHRALRCQALTFSAYDVDDAATFWRGDVVQLGDDTATFAIAPLGPSTFTVCFTNADSGDSGNCRHLIHRGETGLTLDPQVLRFTEGLTREIVLEPAGNGKVLSCFQESEYAGQLQGRCQVLRAKSGQLLIGDSAVVNYGRTFDLALTSLYDDTAVVCFTDSSDQQRGKCRVLWGPWGWILGETRVCRTDAATSCVA